MHAICLDCDNDLALLRTPQTGHEHDVAGGTERHRCLFSQHPQSIYEPVSTR